MDIGQASLQYHRKLKGKISIRSKAKLKDLNDLSLAYTPGVAEVSKAIFSKPESVYELTSKHNTVAVISDGTAVLGLGDIGPLAAIPVMEGKCAIFKTFAGIDAIPIVLDTKDVDEIIRTIQLMAPSFGGINLEDISAPRCFEIEGRLKKLLDIPVFHDDQHGTAIVCGAALINALKVVGKTMDHVRVVINGAGSAGIAIAKFLSHLGVKDLVLCDRFGILEASDERLNPVQRDMAQSTNPNKIKGNLNNAMHQADVFIGVSVGNIVTKEMVQSMHHDAIVFAMANPTPEISRQDALDAGAKVVGNGVSNQPNQINNALVFPGLFKGALKARAKDITIEMQLAACHALAGIVTDDIRAPSYILPNIFNKEVVKRIASAVADAAINNA